MREHVKIVAILNIVLGSLGVLGGIVILLLAGSLAAVISTWANSEDAAQLAPFLAAVAVGLAIFLFILSLPSIIGGWGLLNYRPWARVLMIIISALDLLHVPIGTAIGIYGLWVLLSEEGHRLFETGGRYIPPVSAYPVQTTYPNQPPPGI